jgi:hypothetical protein
MDPADRELNKMLNEMFTDDRIRAMSQYIEYLAIKAQQLLEYYPPEHEFVGLGHCKNCMLIAISKTSSTDFGDGL